MFGRVKQFDLSNGFGVVVVVNRFHVCTDEKKCEKDYFLGTNKMFVYL